MSDVRILPVEPNLMETLRMGLKHFRQRYGVSVAAGDTPTVWDIVEQTLGMFPGVPYDVRWSGLAVAARI